jgi:8'-apo-carotenoid 13,14-cleaving dioxygenase
VAATIGRIIRKTITSGIVKLADRNRGRLKALATSHPFLSGIHEPMKQELSLENLAVTGAVPTELDGRYLRIGPNPATPPQAASYHWFMGDGMVHGVRLKGGKAMWYRNRWIRSNSVAPVLGEAPAPGPRNSPSDTVNTNVVGHAGGIWAMVESGSYPVRIDGDLNTVAYDPFGGTLKGSFAAHPHLDPETGELHAICYNGRQPTKLRHVVVDRSGAVRREEPISVKNGPMVHDCMITPNYVLVLDLPVTFSMRTYVAGQSFPYRWNPEHQGRVGLLPREGSDADIIWCPVDPCFVFHACNSYEQPDGKVILDVCVHDQMFAKSTQGPDSHHVPFERWTIDPATQSVTRNVIDADSQEFPRLNETKVGKTYRYAYTMALPNGGDASFLSEPRLYKHDLETGTKQVHDFGSKRIPGEFVFVPRAGATCEDDGWLVGFVVDLNTETTDLAIVDARDFTGQPIALVHIPHRIPPGFHGNWVAD